MPVDSGSGGSGGTRVVYVDSVQYTTGASRTVITRREKRGSTVYVYRTIYKHYSPPASSAANPGGYGGNKGGKPDIGNPGTNDWVFRRQRLLKALGYPVRVDGVWGPQSQTYWTRYVHGGGTPGSETRDLHRVEAFRARQREAQARAKQSVAQAQHQAELALHKSGAVARLFEKQHATDDIEAARTRASGDSRQRLDRALALDMSPHADPGRQAFLLARRLRRNPGGAKDIGLDDLVSLVTDPATEFDPLNKDDVKIVQTFLKAHGHDKLSVDGTWGAATNDALISSIRLAQKRQRKQQNELLVNTFYDSGILRAGENAPWWWPLAGDTPRPGELLKLLNEGGFSAAIIFRELLRQARTPTAQFAAWRLDQINSIHKAFFGSKPGYGFFERAMPKPQGVKLADILLYPGLDRGQYATLSAQLGALNASSTLDEFKRNLRVYEQKEQAALEEAAKRDAKSWMPGWLGSTLGALEDAANWTQETVVAIDQRLENPEDGGSFKDFLRHPIRFFEDNDLGYDKITDEERARARAIIAGMNPVERIIFELTIDPINLVPFGKLARLTGASLRIGGGALERGGLRLATETQYAFSVNNFGLAVVELGRFVKHVPDTRAYLSEYSHRLVQAMAHTDEMSGVGSQLVANIVAGARLATRLKGEALIQAQRSVEWTARHAFRSVGSLGVKGLQDWKISSATRTLVEQTREQLKVSIPDVFPTLTRELRDNLSSVYIDQGRRYYSNVGRALRARVFEEIRVQEVQRMSYQAARQAAEEARLLGLDDREIRQAMIDAYRQTRNSFGTHVAGAGDPEAIKLLEQRVWALQRRWENTVLPTMQDLLEEWAEQGGKALFDDAGRWAFRQSEAAAALREFAAKSFDDLVEVANPIYRVPMKWDEANKMIESEIRRRTSRIHDFVESEKAAGRSFDEKWVADKLDAETKAVNDAWERVPDKPGFYWDTRETIEVSPMYARHYGLSDDALEGELADLARGTGGIVVRADKTIERDVARAGWMMRGGTPIRNDDMWLDAVRRQFPTNETDNAALGFANAAKAHEVALARASDEALPRALGKQLAIFQALQQVQNRPLRYIHNAVYGSLQTWIFLSLPLRSGWVVRNVIDNFVKSIIHGALDPRAYFPQASMKIGKKIDSFAEAGVRQARHAAYFLDELFGSNVGHGFSAALETFWQQNQDVLKRFFEAYLIDVPDEVLDGARMISYTSPRAARKTDALAKSALLSGDNETISLLTSKELSRALDQDAGLRAAIASFKDGVWELFAQRPEAFQKKALYRSTYRRELLKGKSEVEAWKTAWADVEATLFDYSKITVTEENFKVFFPFIDFWRKNTTFWMKSSIRYPQLPWAVHNYANTMSDINDDLPEWMRRYWKVELPFSDALAKVPGLSWLADYVGNQDVYLDPLNFFSFAPLYRAFKNENPLLPPEDQGLPFIGPFADAIQEWGLGFNPFFSRPMMDAGVFNYRAWQTVFPQTSVFAAISRDFLSERWADRLIDFDAWLGDPIFKALGFGPDASEKVAANFNQYVQMEMANQAARGEAVSRARAKEKIEDFFLVQTILGYFSGAYVRRITPEDVYLYQMGEQMRLAALHPNGDFKEYDDYTEQQQAAYQLFKRRKLDPLEFDRYLESVPVIQGYFNQPSYDAAQAYLEEHPEILPYVSSAFQGKPFSTDNMRNYQLQMDTESAFVMYDLVDKLDLSPEVKQLAEGMLVTPQLREFWSRNDTPLEVQDKMMRGEYFRYINQMQQSYFAIPESDFKAREGFLAEHSVLARWWQDNNSNADDYKAIVNGVNADLRDHYFELLGDEGNPNWDAASSFLKQFPFIFEFTSAASKVDPETGEWIGSGFSSSQHAADYQRAKRFLDLYFSLPESERAAWLNSGTDAARIVRAYFAKYSSDVPGRGGMTQHAQDYLAAKSALDYYFSLAQSKRDDWLHSGNPTANVVLDYFKKYGKTHQITRQFENLPMLDSRNAELRQRLEFWRRYFAMTPDKRPAFIIRESEKYGIYVFGIFGEAQRQAKRNEWMRKAIASGSSARAAAYMWVKPLLDVFFTLSRDEKQLFVRANPELDWYFQNYAQGDSATGDPKLDKLLDQYFNFPPGSMERSMMLRKHPEIQDYFDSVSTPAERAMHNLLEVYFAIPSGPARKEFLFEHPEIQAYFDRRADERAFEQEQLLPFELADPRMQKYLAGGAGVVAAGQREAAKLAYQKASRLAGDTLTVRRRRETS